MTNPIETIYGDSGAAYVDAMTPSPELSRAVESLDSTQHSLAYNNFDSIFPSVSGRAQYDRGHYEYFRPGEALPRKYKDVIEAIDAIYCGLPIVRNIIDLMSDFGSEGIKIVHPVASIEKFYQEWFKKINGADRSERFLSCLYRHGMVVIREMNATVPNKKIENLISTAASDIKLKTVPVKKREIPFKFYFYNPSTFVHENYHELNAAPRYKIYKPQRLYTENIFCDKMLMNTAPESVDANKLYVAYYKKDDWNARPAPFIYPIIKHAIMLEKLYLADSSALDGAISKIRIFKLGDKEKKLFPTPSLISKLDQLMRSNTSGGTIDIIWGPDIELIESNTDIHNFLGQEKYIPYLTQVYEGLGIPASFVGVGTGTTNNYISLKILTRRLQSGREKLIEFWNSQIRKVQLAMGFNEPAYLEFDNLDLGDEESERNILIQLLDREIVSEERVLKILGFDPRMENKRIKRESSQRKSNRRAQKAGQFHTPEKEFVLQKVSLEKGYLSPEQVGVNPVPGTENDKSPNEEKMKHDEKTAKDIRSTKVDKNSGSGGRPQGAKDVVKRKTKTFKPAIKATVESWLLSAQNDISEIVKTAMLKSLNKKNMRQLTQAEYSDFEQIKFGILLNVEPMARIDSNRIFNIISKGNDREYVDRYKASISEFKEALNREPNVEECKIIQRSLYLEKHYENI